MTESAPLSVPLNLGQFENIPGRKLVHRTIKKITVTYDDGHSETWELPSSAQGFHRQRLTYDQVYEDGVTRIGDQIIVNEVFWTLKVEPARP